LIRLVDHVTGHNVHKAKSLQPGRFQKHVVINNTSESRIFKISYFGIFSGYKQIIPLLRAKVGKDNFNTEFLDK
jgi:hypothetical protein